MTKEVLSTYEEIAPEYYDSDRHPTCANFRAASHQSLLKFLRSADVNGKIVCEVGPGKSLLAEVLAELDCRPAEIILIDLSPSMLRYSAQSGSRQKHAIIGDGRILPLRGRSIDLLVSSLGDPYNEISFGRKQAEC